MIVSLNGIFAYARRVLFIIHTEHTNKMDQYKSEQTRYLKTFENEIKYLTI